MRLRALVVVLVVLVLGAWSCQVPTDTGRGCPESGGCEVPISTTGLTALVAGEDWHYVGEAGEPAFETGWDNVSGYTKMAFRIREAGVVDIQGGVVNSTTASPNETIFTLPAGYVPSTPAYMIPSSSSHVDIVIFVNTFGQVIAVTSDANVQGILVISGQFFLTPPDGAP